jgi:hypothetical protein
MPPRKTAKKPPLSWFPLGPLDWLKLSAGLLPQEAGALMNLMMAAFGEIDEPCTIPAEPARLHLMSGLGASWAMHADRVLHGWERTESGRLRHTWLYQRWQEQMEKASARRTAGKAGADRKWRGKRAQTELELSPEPAAAQASAPTNAELARDSIAIPNDGNAMQNDGIAIDLACRGLRGGAPPSEESTTPTHAKAREGALEAPLAALAARGPDDPDVAAAERWIADRAADRADLAQAVEQALTALLGPPPAAHGSSASARHAHRSALAFRDRRRREIRQELLLERHAEYRAERSHAGPRHASGPEPTPVGRLAVAGGAR